MKSAYMRMPVWVFTDTAFFFFFFFFFFLGGGGGGGGVGEWEGAMPLTHLGIDADRIAFILMKIRLHHLTVYF